MLGCCIHTLDSCVLCKAAVHCVLCEAAVHYDHILSQAAHQAKGILQGRTGSAAGPVPIHRCQGPSVLSKKLQLQFEEEESAPCRGPAL